MKALDTSVLIEYLRSDNRYHDHTADVIESYTGTWYAPTPVIWEALRYAAQTQRHKGVETTVAALDWLVPLPLSIDVVQEAACIEAELLDEGTPINPLDMLIAGVIREAGAVLVTRDSDFNHVDDLDVERLLESG